MASFLESYDSEKGCLVKKCKLSGDLKFVCLKLKYVFKRSVILSNHMLYFNVVCKL